jgi:peptide/nickel transport system substrate-binding protein
MLGSAAMIGIASRSASPAFSQTSLTPKRGGVLRIGVADSSTFDTLDPTSYTTNLPKVLTIGQLTNCLVEIDDRTQVIPELAESWEPSKDASQWILRLRKDVEFHNGKSFEAEDVVYSLNLHRGADSKSASKATLKPVTDIKIHDRHTLEVRLEHGNADFLYLLADYRLQILPNGYRDWSKGVGTGGYILESFEPGIRAKTRRNPNYWKQGRAHFDEIETVGINDFHARLAALQTDAVDVINRCDRHAFERISEFPNIRAIKSTGFVHYAMPMRADAAPFDNNDVRLAFKYAVNRETMLNNILEGHGSLGNDQPISVANRYHADIPQRTYDPDRAKFHLKKAGYGRIAVDLSTADVAFPGAVDAAVLFKEQAAVANIDVNVVRESDDSYWSSVWRKKPFCLSYWYGRPTEDWMFSTTYASGAPFNESGWVHPKFDKLLLEARSSFDESLRRQIYSEMQWIVHEEGSTIVPLFASDLMAASNKLAHGSIAPNLELDGYKLSERWWFA